MANKYQIVSASSQLSLYLQKYTEYKEEQEEEQTKQEEEAWS